MQPDVITLSVDTDNNSGTADDTIVYSRFGVYNNNRSVYIADDHSIAMRNTLGFYRTPEKQSGNFRGVAKAAIKFTMDRLVPGVDSTSSIVAPQIMDLSFANPVGLTPAETLAMRMRGIALLSNPVVMAALVDQLLI